MKNWMLVAAACLIAGAAQAAEPMKMKGFYIGMSKAEALKAFRRDMPAAEQYPVLAHESQYPGTDSIVMVRENGGAPAAQAYAYLAFEKGYLKYFRLEAQYFDASNMDAGEFSKAVLKSYPLADVSCKGFQCIGNGPAGEQVRVVFKTVEVYQPLPPPPPGPKPKFD